MPRLPVDDFKIVFRPSVGVDLAQYNDGELRATAVANSGLRFVAADEDLVCTNLAKNIFTVSTSCTDRVANYAKILELTQRGKKLGFHAYIALPDGARAGIIYRAWNGESPQDSLQELRRANPLLPIVQARDMGCTSRSVLIHFMAEELPPSVKMFGILYAIFNFRTNVEVCLNCRQVGHQRDVCPLPNCLTCSGCGQKHPQDYPCTPQCVICGDAHKTGDRACKQRFQRAFSRLSRPRQRPQQEHQQEQPEFQLEKEFFSSIDNRNRSSRFKSPGRNRSSRSRSPGRNHGSKGKSPGRSASQSRDFSTEPEKVSWAKQASCSCCMLSDAKENSKIQETIERLMRENQELKQQLALVLERLGTLTTAPPASSPPLSISPSVIEPDMAAESGTDIIDSSPQPAKKKRTERPESLEDNCKSTSQKIRKEQRELKQKVDLRFTQIAERFNKIESILDVLVVRLESLPQSPPSPAPSQP
ncbi:hypothetical protein HPB51_005142 [Rhipicephalus microplus]|uniref:CCHC-type domain-containing protein n=1 Tax=Rhipicephalus microplus TaxID=6941 RepID=A0A9J6EM26_RHIMP|nr:hypothetical protein HPB51_005142 [Rhipicephalus microplus]